MGMPEYQLLKTEGHARRGILHTAHGSIQTPVFMNVATQAAIKGAVAASDLPMLNCQVALANTYHLHVRPGDELIRELGGLHRFMNWNVLPGRAQKDSRRGGFFSFACRWKKALYGAGGKHADSGESRFRYRDGI